jgi:hypothetical protein
VAAVKNCISPSFICDLSPPINPGEWKDKRPDTQVKAYSTPSDNIENGKHPGGKCLSSVHWLGPWHQYFDEESWCGSGYSSRPVCLDSVSWSYPVHLWEWFTPGCLPFWILSEGPEEVKWELGFAYFLGGKMGFHALGLGFIGKKTIENGNGIKIWAGQPLRWWNLCSGTMRFSQNLGWKIGIRPPPPLQDTLIRGVDASQMRTG